MFELTFHKENLLITPLVAFRLLVCENEDCEAVHGMGLEIGWLFWTVRIAVFRTND